jgi:multiple sugar transport system ATP-binding protein
MSDAVGVRLEGIAKTYAGGEVAALDGVDLAIEPGSFFSILGPSGCGKTTLLRIIAGFEYPSSGRVFIGERDVTSLSPRDRDIAMVFQDYALYPHMTAAQNITFNLRNRRVPRAEIAARLAETAAILGIERLLNKKPAQLSGGERQRVALGRAMIRKPRVFLMDEPLSNLDLKLREQMRIELGRLHQTLGVTVVFVTHDQAEAMTLSSALAVMRAGRLQQVGVPDRVYARPANAFVARFIGSPSMNLLRMAPADGRLRAVGAPEASLPLPSSLALPVGRELLVGIRPHQLKVVGAKDGEGLPVRVSLTEHLGRHNFVVCHPAANAGYLHEQDAIQIETDADTTYPMGTMLKLSADPGALRLFDTEGELIEGQS